MIYLLYGPDTYTRDKKARELATTVRMRAPSLLERRIFLDEDGAVEEAFDALAPVSLFAGEKKLVRLSGFSDALAHPLMSRLCLAAAASDVVCILSESWSRKDLPKKILAVLESIPYKSQFFPSLSEGACSALIIQEAHAQGVRVTTDAARLLVSVHGNDLQASMLDVAKWSLMTDTIDAAFLNIHGDDTLPYSFFTDAQILGGRGNMATRLTAWERACAYTADRYGLFYYLAKATGDAETIMALASVDEAVKSGRLDLDSALLHTFLV